LEYWRIIEPQDYIHDHTGGPRKGILQDAFHKNDQDNADIAVVMAGSSGGAYLQLLASVGKGGQGGYAGGGKRQSQEIHGQGGEMAGVDLEEFNGQPQIDLQSLAKEYSDSIAIDSQMIENKLALAPEELAKIRKPQGRPLYGWITRSYKVDVDNDAEKHTGIDFAVKRGTSVAATASGVVVFAGWDKIMGNLVVINHDENYQTLYGHNDKLLVEKGQEVLKGDIIAISGNTGRSSAPHLHYEIRKDGEPVDPAPYLD